MVVTRGIERTTVHARRICAVSAPKNPVPSLAPLPSRTLIDRVEKFTSSIRNLRASLIRNPLSANQRPLASPLTTLGRRVTAAAAGRRAAAAEACG